MAFPKRFLYHGSPSAFWVRAFESTSAIGWTARSRTHVGNPSQRTVDVDKLGMTALARIHEGSFSMRRHAHPLRIRRQCQLRLPGNAITFVHSSFRCVAVFRMSRFLVALLCRLLRRQCGFAGMRMRCRCCKSSAARSANS